MNRMPEAIQVVNRVELGEAIANAPTIVRYLDYRGQIAWYKEQGQGSSVNRNEAWVFRSQECYGRRMDDPDDARYEILPSGTPLGYLDCPAPMDTPAVALPLMEQRLVKTAIDMLKVAPKNPVARAYVQAAVRLPVPEELETYEAISEWFEKNYTPSTTPTVPENQAPAARRRAPQLGIQIPYTEDVSGTCTYTSRVHGIITDRMDVDDLISLIDDNSCEDMDELVTAVVNSAQSEGEQDITDEDNFTHSDYELQGSGGTETEPDRRELAERLRDFLAEHSPETLESLGE